MNYKKLCLLQKITNKLAYQNECSIFQHIISYTLTLDAQ
jgi:hypothetical protein